MSDKYVITIDADTIAALKKLKEVGNEAKAAAKDQVEAAKGSGQAWQGFKGTLGALGIVELYRSIGAAASAAFKASVQSALDLESGLAKVQTLLSKTQNATSLFTDDVLRLQATYGTDQKDSLQAYYDVLSSGATDAAGAIQVLDVANKLAIGGVTTLTIAQNGLTSILNAYGLAASESAHIADVLFIGAKAGKTDIAGLSQSIGNVAPLAHSMNVSIEELVASISALTTAGVPTAEAVTQVRSALTGLANQTPEMTKALRSLGIQSIQAGIEQYGFEGILKKVIGTTNGSVEALGDLFGRVEAVGGVTALTSGKIGGVFVGALAEMRDKSKEAGSVTQQSFEDIAKTTQFKLNTSIGEASANMTRLGTVITTGVGPAVAELIRGFSNLVLVPLVKFLQDNAQLLPQMAVALLAGSTAATAFAGSMLTANVATSAMLVSVGSIGAIITVGAVAIAATIKYVDELSLGFVAMSDSILAALSQLPGLSDAFTKNREVLAQTGVEIQKSIDARAADAAASETQAAAAKAASEAALTASTTATAGQLDNDKKKLDSIFNLTKEERRKAEENAKALYELDVKALAQKEELKILAADSDVISTDARLAGLVDELGREAGIKAEAQLRAYEAQKKTVENTQALEIIKRDINKQTLDRQIQDQTRTNQGLLTLQEEHDNKILDEQKKQADEARKIRDGDLNYFTNTEDRKVEYAQKTEREKLDVARNGFQVLAGVSKDGNKTLGEIGKAASIAGATIDTYKAATGAYASLAGIPGVGPALGAAAAAAAVIAGLANVRAISSQRFERGGIVQGSSYTGDNIGVRVNSGELILNRAQQKNLAPQLGGNDNADLAAILLGVRSDIQNIKLIIGDEDVFSANKRQIEAGRI